MLPVVQVTCSPTSGHAIISSHLPKWAKPIRAEGQGQNRSPVQGMLIIVINSQIMQPESLQPILCPCTAAAAALQHSAAALAMTVMPLADVTNRLNSNKSCWKVPVSQEMQLFTGSRIQDTVKPVQSHSCTSHRYTPSHGTHVVLLQSPCLSDVYSIACPNGKVDL